MQKEKKRILLTGATGYIGKRLLLTLLEQGHTVICAVRDKQRFHQPEHHQNQCHVVEIDLLNPETLKNIPKNIDIAFYLVHSMSFSAKFDELESKCANQFKDALNTTQVEQVIYLSGIVHQTQLSQHLTSRKEVESILSEGKYALTTLRAGIIIGSGSASFEIIRDVVEKLPIMITPKWVYTKCQPIAIRDVIASLYLCMGLKSTYHKNFDIGGPDILSYKDMLLGYAKVRGLKRLILTLPVLTPKLSAYWLYLVTAVSFKLAKALVSSMTIDIVCRDSTLLDILGITPLSYEKSLEKAFEKIDSHQIESSWKDAIISSKFEFNIKETVQVPTFGCFVDAQKIQIKNREKCIEKIWSIGGNNGWYYGNFLWEIRGVLDKLAGGVGLRRGRTNPNTLYPGDSLDLWRVLYADKEEGRLLLFAEMKLPGDAWLEFKIIGNTLFQTATFRPLGLWGRLYWILLSPFHYFIFNGLIKALAKTED